MPAFTECKCCKEFEDLLDDKLSARCVTNREAFDTLILNKSVLEVAFIKHRRYKGNFTEVKEMTLKLVIFFVTILLVVLNISNITTYFNVATNMNSVFFPFIYWTFYSHIIKKHHKNFFSRKIKKKDQNQNLQLNCTWFLFAGSCF